MGGGCGHPSTGRKAAPLVTRVRMGEASRMPLEATEMDGFTDEQFLTLFPQAWNFAFNL